MGHDPHTFFWMIEFLSKAEKSWLKLKGFPPLHRLDFNRPFPSSLVPLFQNESK